MSDKIKRKIRNTLRIKKDNKHKRPVLSVFRSNKNIVAQIIDVSGVVLVAFSSLSKDIKNNLKGKKGVEIAEFIGEGLAKKAIDAGIKEVVFNKGPYKYIGRVKALADGARKAGLIF